MATLRVCFNFFNFGASLCLILLSGCGATPTPVQPLASPDAYVAGAIYDSTGRGIATSWKNGVATTLGGSSYGSYVSGIAVSGTDVYVSGAQDTASGNDIALYWKNGTPYPLTDGTAQASTDGIFVSGSDVYVAGGESPLSSLPAGFVGYWKNGTPVSIPGDGIQINAIFVSGSDVYLAGTVTQTTTIAPNSSYQTPIATVWKNGVPAYLTDSLHFSLALSIFVSGSDVYVAGAAAHTAEQLDIQTTYWKNGVPIVLSASPLSVPGNATSIAVSGQDVYVAGGDSVNRAEYWKNGVRVPLLGSHTGQIAVSGGHAFVAGSNDLGAAIYWEDGRGSLLAPTANSSLASAIAVTGS